MCPFPLSILILQGHSLKRIRPHFVRWGQLPFNPHFTRTLSETTCRQRDISLAAPFNPHFTRTLSETSLGRAINIEHGCLSILILQGHSLKLSTTSWIHEFSWTLSILILQGHSLKPHAAHYDDSINTIFQSSFYKDTLWNAIWTESWGQAEDLSILILQGHSLKPEVPGRICRKVQLSILILQGHSLKRCLLFFRLCTCRFFQSSFYKDTLWNGVLLRGGGSRGDLSILILQGHSLKPTFAANDVSPYVLSILILQGHSLKLTSVIPTAERSKSFNPHFTRTLSETQRPGCIGVDSFDFQSSFYKDTLWNCHCWPYLWNRESLSILILQGHSLKQIENSDPVLVGRPFNPHFTRTLSETVGQITSSIPVVNFQSSFYKDTLWNVIVCDDLLFGGLAFNPHFTRTLSETGDRRAEWEARRILSILILQGHSLKLWDVKPLAWQSDLSILILQGHSLKHKSNNIIRKYFFSFNPHFTRTLSETLLFITNINNTTTFQSSFYKDTLWNCQVLVEHKEQERFQSSFYKDTLWNILAGCSRIHCSGLSILILQGHSLKHMAGRSALRL